MSRVGKKVIEIPSAVSVVFANEICTVKGPKGELTFGLDSRITHTREGETLSFHRNGEDKKVRAMHGLTRARIAWMIEGVLNGFTKNLQIEGVGYKAEMRGKSLQLSLGFSHAILFIPPDGIEFVVSSPTLLAIKGYDKEVVGEVAAKVRKLRPPEPYKGKGVRYVGEYVRRKTGKSAGK
ncbi:MAG: 50S ribosomal protein L6 [Ignavibacteria bacterium]|nr:50S ribosomal protein L6 [Ignavibacteria bacterium]